MKNTLTIARREFRSYFNSPAAFIVGTLFLIVVAVMFWNSFFLEQRASVRRLFFWTYVVSAFVAPAITMGLLAEEKRTGTLELLITYPVKDSEVVLGKYLGALGLYAVLLLLTLPQVFSVSGMGPLDWGPVWSGYLGLLLSGGAFLALGVLASSWTSNQLVALIVALALAAFFSVIRHLLVFLPSGAASVFEWLSFGYHADSLERGVIDTRDVFFFFSVIALSLGLAFRSLESRLWR
ncbi:MAG: ABC transporter permease subunit [Polyangiales bacterium]